MLSLDLVKKQLPEGSRWQPPQIEVNNNKAVLSGPPENATATGVDRCTPSKASWSENSLSAGKLLDIPIDQTIMMSFDIHYRIWSLKFWFCDQQCIWAQACLRGWWEISENRMAQTNQQGYQIKSRWTAFPNVMSLKTQCELKLSNNPRK